MNQFSLSFRRFSWNFQAHHCNLPVLNFIIISHSQYMCKNEETLSFWLPAVMITVHFYGALLGVSLVVTIFSFISQISTCGTRQFRCNIAVAVSFHHFLINHVMSYVQVKLNSQDPAIPLYGILTTLRDIKYNTLGTMINENLRCIQFYINWYLCLLQILEQNILWNPCHLTFLQNIWT